MTSFRDQRTFDVIAFAIRNHIVISFQQSSFENTIVKSFQFATNHSNELISVEKNSSKNELVVFIIVSSFKRVIVVSSKIENFEFDDQIDYAQLRANQTIIEKRTIDKREYKLFVTRIRQLNTTSFRKSEINSIDVIEKKRLRLRKSFNSDDNCKEQKFKIIEELRFELRQATRSSKLERSRRESISIILQFDQRYTQQIETFNRNLSNSYD